MPGWASTGIESLDAMLGGLQKGDNVVWQVDGIDDFAAFVAAYVERASRQGRRIVYIRFADHKPLVQPGDGVQIHHLDADGGFESFTTEIHTIIADEGKEAHYVFDCLSHLLDAWATDLMIGNFFMVTCSFLSELEAVAYFALLRNRHSFRTIRRIRETTQLLLNLYNVEGRHCLHALKVSNRYSPTMFLPHLRENGTFVPITSSVEATRLLARVAKRRLKHAERALDYWDALFLRAAELSEFPKAREKAGGETLDRLCRIMIGRDKRMLALAKKHFTLTDLCAVKNRVIGTGFLGGKAVGMLLGNKIIAEDKSDLKQYMEPHDSFYVGSDVFYTYLIENGCWKLRLEQKTKEGYFKVAGELRDKLLDGKFPDRIREQFQEMIEYFGQSPIIVRSSSLLEDAFGNAFPGKYESIFCTNQGNPEQRYTNFENAVRTVYASMMSEDALTYRLQRGLDQQDEQMALLVQRVSGSYQNSYFFPDLAGVGMSYNTFVWKPDLDATAGMLRLVFGLGTRAVNRVDDDYPRVIALDQPLVRPVSGMDDVRKYSQHRVDLLDIEQNALSTVLFSSLVASPTMQRASHEVNSASLPLDLVAVRDHQLARQMRQSRDSLGDGETEYWLLTFEKLLSKTPFVRVMQSILKTLERHYEYPVDIEFTVNFAPDGGSRAISGAEDESQTSDAELPVSFFVNLLQCRPLQTRGQQAHVRMPAEPDPNKILFKCEGYFMGGSIRHDIKKIIYVEPAAYIGLPLSAKYDIARLVGELNKRIEAKETEPTIFLGPGRWGTTTPSLGVPVGFHDINNAAVLAEIAYEGGDLMPEMSFGTHFFQDLVEENIFYVALFPDKGGAVFNKAMLDEMPSHLTAILPESAKYADVVKLLQPDRRLRLLSDVTSQKAICLFD
ncbi:MAG: PEP/pyruvate-binding domain-containing protein [Sedimentisphaerales bacterium]